MRRGWRTPVVLGGGRGGAQDLIRKCPDVMGSQALRETRWQPGFVPTLRSGLSEGLSVQGLRGVGPFIVFLGLCHSQGPLTWGFGGLASVSFSAISLAPLSPSVHPCVLGTIPPIHTHRCAHNPSSHSYFFTNLPAPLFSVGKGRVEGRGPRGLSPEGFSLDSGFRAGLGLLGTTLPFFSSHQKTDPAR